MTRQMKIMYKNSFVSRLQNYGTYCQNLSTLFQHLSQLGLLLEKVPDNPPTAGHTAVSSNSLIDRNLKSGDLCEALTFWLNLIKSIKLSK